MEKAYPTKNGMPIPTIELDLPPTHMKAGRENLHHLHFTSRTAGRLIMSQTLRDLDSEQEMMQPDQHNMGRHCLHALYLPPEPPTPRQMMDRLEEAKVSGSQLNLRQKGLGYVKHEFTNHLWDKILREYNEII